MMKCSMCKTKNRVYANYCIKCAYKFSEKEQKKAKSKTLVGRLEAIEKWYKRLTLKVITDHIVVKIATLLIVLSIGIYTLLSMGNSFKLLESDIYKLGYDSKKQEYYLIVDDLDKVPLKLFVPSKCNDINIVHYNENNDVISNDKYTSEDKIILNTNILDYYVLKANYKNNKVDEFKLFIYKKDDIEYDESSL